MGSREAPLSAEAVQTCDQCLRLGTVLHQQEQLWRVHAHPRIYRQKGEMESGAEGWGPRGESLVSETRQLAGTGTLEEELAREGRSQIFSLAKISN